jgi:hypothetical protein
VPAEDISLREHFEKLLSERSAQTELRFVMLERAVDKAETSIDRRMSVANEFRETLKDQAREFVTVAVLNAQVGALSERLDRLADRIGSLEKREANLLGRVSMIGVGFAILVVLINVAMHWVK